MAFDHRTFISCALGALMTAPALAQGGAQPTQGTAPSGASNSSEAGTPASAEGVAQVPAAVPGQDNSAIQEIVVTANKREENLQKVAGTVTAVSQAALTRQGVKDITDINKVVPEVRVQPGTYTNISIRGIRTGSYGPTTDSPNAVHVDGVYLSRFTGLNGYFFDVQRVEALAGPQGTLYGRNSAGGTINIITNKPTMDDAKAQGSIEYGNYNAFTVNAAVNVPLSETLAVRAAYYHLSHRGYANNGLDDAAINSGRLSLLWKPNSSDSFLLTADRELIGGSGVPGGGNGGAIVYQSIKDPTVYLAIDPTTGVRSASLTPPGTGSTSVAGSGVVVPIVAATGPRDSNSLFGAAEGNKQDTRSRGYMGQYDHDFGWASLTAQAAFRETYSNNPSFSARFPQDSRLVTTGVLRPTAPSFQSAHANWTTQEIRLTSPSNQVITYTLGLYHFRERSYDNHSGSYFANYPNTGYLTAASTIGQVVIPSVPSVNSDIGNELQIDNAYAAFGQVVLSPAFLEGLHLTGGLRYNYEKKHGVGNTILNGTNCAGGCFDQRATFKKVTYKANVAYDITPRNTVYFDNSTGFRSGGFSYGLRARYEPENITAYEIGSKNRFFDNRLQVNLSAWHYDYRNIVTTIGLLYINPQLPPPGIAVTITAVNGQKAKVDGQSASFIAQVTPDDSLTFNGTHLNARFTKFDIHQFFQLPIGPNGALIYLSPGATDATYNYSHTPIGNAAKYAFSATYDHVFHVFGGELDAQAFVQYVGRRLAGNQVSKADTNLLAQASLDPYATADISLRYAPAGSRWAITAYVRNLTNKSPETAATYVSNNAFLPASDPRVTYAYTTRAYGPPRTYGAILSFNF